MKRRTMVTNVALGAALVGSIAVAVAVMSDPAAAEDTAPRTATVSTGEVTSTVSATGNLAAATAVGVNFAGTGGTVTEVFVTTGDVVKKGARLAAVDDRSAQTSLESARASLRQAQAQLSQTTQGQTAAERERDASSIESAEVQVSNAKKSVDQAKATRDLDASQQDALVASALSAYNAASTPAAKASAQAALEQARRTQSSTNLRNQQAVDSAKGQLASAEASLASARASARVGAQPPKTGTVDAAEAQVASARAQVRAAENAVDDTVLRAPVDGTVASIAAGVGESSSTSTTASSGGSSSDGSVSTTATGFVVLTSLDALQVTSRIAEADAGDVAVGQQVSVSFEAAGMRAAGTVTDIDLIETVSDNVVEYGVTVNLYDAPAGLRLGQSADVTIVTASVSDVLTVNSSAITTAAGTSTVTRLKADGAEETITVETGVVGEASTQIVSGLKNGDVVVLPEGGGAGGFTFPGGAPPGLGGLGGGLG